MRAPIVALSVCILAFAGSVAPAEEVSIPLPKDGAWAKYHVTSTNESQTSNQVSTRYETIRFVGIVNSNDQTRRWVEQMFSGVDGNRTNVMKALVSESDLNSAWPLAGKRRWWHKVGDTAVTEVETLGPEFGISSLVFPGPYDIAKSIEEGRTIDYQRGKLELRIALTGEQKYSVPDSNPNRTFVMKYTAWHHPDVPMGLAAAKVSLTTKETDSADRHYTAEFVIDDFGMDAKSALPDSN